MTHSEQSRPDSSERLRRLGRLTLKELREILRDRRTIVTLVLMPLFLYPLLSIVFQQFFMSQLGRIRMPRYTIGFESEEVGQYLSQLLAEGGLTLVASDDQTERGSPGVPGRAIVRGIVASNLTRAVEDFEIDVGMRLAGGVPPEREPDSDVALDVELVYHESSPAGREAAGLIQRHLQAAGEKLLAARLRSLGVTQRAVPVRVSRVSLADSDATAGGISIAAVIPFILILMTVTGAVYPAIDLTAGERERGTLEVLIAAPIPRLGVLFAKYVAVLTVALLTAAANLLTMTITIAASGLGGLLFGESGISPGVIAAVFGLLLLFAAFFSAVLLVITSSARSFKEAQAYLIPVTLLALAPGVLGLMPGLELSGVLLVTPLANIVLLGRDLFAMKASGGAALTVVASTLIYAGAAIGIAARIFGAESVLYSSQPGWADLFRRPREPQSAPSLTAALTSLAVMFPLYFLLIRLLGEIGQRDESSAGPAAEVGRSLLAGVVITTIVFGAVPAFACWLRRVQPGRIVRFPAAPAAVFAGALLVGASLWMFDHEAVMFGKELRGFELDPNVLRALRNYATALQDLPAPLVIFCIAVVPAVFEEFFFRGYLFAALRTAGNAWNAIVASAAIFGLFHAVVPNPLASERLLSSTITGLVLGWVRWRTGSVLPGMLLHLCHNGLLALLMCYEPQLAERGVGISETSHLPAAWLAVGGSALVAGLTMILISGRGDDPARVPQ